MEQSEKDSAGKALALIDEFHDYFLEITYTAHPTGLNGEMRGKSSNTAW